MTDKNSNSGIFSDAVNSVTIYAFYSEEGAKTGGYAVAEVTDPKAEGGSRLIKYTLQCINADAKGYRYADRQLVWSGQRKDITTISIHPGGNAANRLKPINCN
jgi:hypothetical protein